LTQQNRRPDEFEEEDRIREKYRRLILELDRDDVSYLANRNELMVHQDLLIERLYETSSGSEDASSDASTAKLYARLAAAHSRTQLELQVALHHEIRRWKRLAPIAFGVVLVALYWVVSR
jgi:hypothetical protein